ncbi:MAG: hypothetical protein Q4F38_05845 [Akkermansia sp.]|nr:hypothetical protein [Akkermansia sp.]
MITGKPSKILAAVALLMVSAFADAAQRARTFGEAMEKAGDDGVIAYCYGPDWNQRSVVLLNSFWKSPAAEEAAGNAVMVAVPFYEKDTAKGAEDAAEIRGDMPEPPFMVCPTVMFFDKSGRRYASFQGADYLGSDDECTEGVKNIAKNIQALRRQQELMSKAASLVGKEKAKLLAEVADLPIEKPENLMSELELADPTDKLGAIRRNKFNALQFMYKQLDTPDGFIKPDFEADYQQMRKDCEEVFKDEAIRPRDRQAVYNLFIGQSRREAVHGNQLKGFIKRVNKLDDTTDYGKLSPTLVNLWGNLKHKLTPEERKAAREAKRAKAKERKNRKRDERRSKSTIEVE